jgi:hypothetical protein
LGENVCDVLASLMAVLSQNSIFGQNPKIGYQEFDDLQTSKLSKKQLCDRTDGSHPPNSLMDSIQEICKTYHDAIRVTNFAIALAPFGVLWGARVKALRPEVLVQSIDALYAKDHTRPAVARALRSVAQVDDTPTCAHCREGDVGSAIRHMET